MVAPGNDFRIVRFGPFEVDFVLRKLSKHGAAVHLQEKPFQLLSQLLVHAGNVVTREELRLQLWQSDTFVEFDEGVNTAVAKLRYALGDSSASPVFVETLRGKGYRWVAPVERLDAAPEGNQGPSPHLSREVGDHPTQSANSTFLRKKTIPVALAISATLLLAGAYTTRRVRVRLPLTELKQRQLTTNSTDNPVSANAISPDGKYLAYADLKGLHLKLTTTGEVRDIPNPEPYHGSYVSWGIPQNWFPDGSRFLVNTNLPYQPVSTWIVSVLGSAPRKLRDGAGPWSVSSQGMIAFTTRMGRAGDREIWAMNTDGLEPEKLLETDEDSGFSMLVWSPDGRRLAYVKDHNHSGINEASIEVFDLRTRFSSILVSNALLTDFSRLPPGLRSLVWLPNGRFIYSTGKQDIDGFSCNYWELRLDRVSNLASASPQPLTNWNGFCVLDVGATADGKQLVFQKVTDHLNVFVAGLTGENSLASTPRRLTDQQSREYPTGWTPDGKAVIFASNRDGRWEIFKQRPEEEQAVLLASGLASVANHTPLTPDGSSYLNVSMLSGESARTRQVLKIPVEGGAPEELISGSIFDVRCSRRSTKLCVMGEESADQKEIIFSELDASRGRGRELARVKREDVTTGYEWTLSPDGRTIAFTNQFDNKIGLIPLDDRARRVVEVKNWKYLRDVDWTADGKGFFASHPSKRGGALLLVNLRGTARVLWELPGQNVYLRPLPSPDGRRIAILGSQVENNVWMMEDF